MHTFDTAIPLQGTYAIKYELTSTKTSQNLPCSVISNSRKINDYMPIDNKMGTSGYKYTMDTIL
jgi:hypothetical protein